MRKSSMFVHKNGKDLIIPPFTAESAKAKLILAHCAEWGALVANPLLHRNPLLSETLVILSRDPTVREAVSHTTAIYTWLQQI